MIRRTPQRLILVPHSKSKEVAKIALPCVEAPIGVFDSGVGGLSVLREIRAELPKEDLIYVTDARHAPYGNQSPHFIRQRAIAIVEFFISNDAKAIVVACNTATAVGIHQLRSQFDIPLVAIEPAVKPAAKTTRSGVIGILATPLTLESERFVNLLTQYGKDTKVLVQPCPGLVEQVERASFDNGATKALLKEYVSPLIQQGADTIVLGCTHYSFLKPAIVSIVGSGVSIIDPAMLWRESFAGC